MVVETEYCDRCGKVCGKHDCTHGFHIFRKFVLADVLKHDQPMSLCQSCYNDLAEWMKGDKSDKEKGDKQQHED